MDWSHHYICSEIANISHVDKHDDGGKVGAHYVIYILGGFLWFVVVDRYLLFDTSH